MIAVEFLATRLLVAACIKHVNNLPASTDLFDCPPGGRVDCMCDNVGSA